MWENIEARIEQNEREQMAPVRNALFSVIRESGLRPGGGATKKMVAFEFGPGERLVWQIEGTAQHFYLHQKWQPRLEEAGFPCKLFPYERGLKDGGRHSALSRDWSFGTADCVQVKLDAADALRHLIGLLLSEGEALHLDSAAVARWIDRLRKFFPGLDRFDRPDADFDAAERAYKLETVNALRPALESAETDQAVVAAILAAASSSNLLDWHTYHPLTPRGNADRARLDPALAALARAALGPAEGHPAALDAFVAAWRDAVPKGSDDAARQIGEFLFLHLWPDEGIYFRYSVREDLWREAVGSSFPNHASMADTYSDEMRFMRAVRQAFEDRGLAPRDMIDVQSALWVVHSYKDGDEDDAKSSSFTREAIESAMDAYDEYRKSGKSSEIFDSFGEPRDYWVRSTRERAERVYPTKPIVGYILRKTELNGGWGQKTDAAARLHNAGFIIVAQDDNPVTPPERYDHLVRDADRIRLCALNYFIEPAREQGASEVSIRAGDLAAAMGLQDAFPNICQALGGGKFQQLAQVPPPTHTEPNPSSSTIFTYKLRSQAEADPVAEATTKPTPSATNLILYGPPGTGKTYQTAWEAVRLCLGERAAAALQGDEKRDALMVEYRRLVSEGRIEFVTFHQLMSYEEFVEGLRPETQSAEGQELDTAELDTAGFRLKVEDGIFKRICERARLDPGDGSGDRRLDRTRPIFKVALGRRFQEEKQIKDALDANEIRHGWSGKIDWSDDRFEDWAEIKTELERRTGKEVSGYAGELVCTFSFRSDMQVGDYVVVSDGRDRMRAFGTIASDYFFEADAEHHPHRRRVEWLWRDDQGTERARFYSNGFRQHTVYKLNGALVDWDGLEGIVFGVDRLIPAENARTHVLIIDEINRANISKVFGELITLLEPDKRLRAENEIRLTLSYSKRLFGVPANLHVIGTMNTADRSIALLDTALRRRFTFREMMPDASVLEEAAQKCGIDLPRLLSTINERIEYLYDREHQIGHAYFTACSSRADVDKVMRHKVIPLLAEYFFEDWAKIAAVLGDLEPHEGPITGGFLKRSILKAPPGLEDGDAVPRFRWEVRSEGEGFDYGRLAGT